MSKEAQAYKKEVKDALDSSKKVIEILKALSSNTFPNQELSRSIKDELLGLTTEINSLVSDLKASCNKALALCENVTSLNSVKNNIKDFDDSFERFKSISSEEEIRKY